MSDRESHGPHPVSGECKGAFACDHPDLTRTLVWKCEACGVLLPECHTFANGESFPDLCHAPDCPTRCDHPVDTCDECARANVGPCPHTRAADAKGDRHFLGYVWREFMSWVALKRGFRG
jgi:hypothetical protein